MKTFIQRVAIVLLLLVVWTDLALAAFEIVPDGTADLQLPPKVFTCAGQTSVPVANAGAVKVFRSVHTNPSAEWTADQQAGCSPGESLTVRPPALRKAIIQDYALSMESLAAGQTHVYFSLSSAAWSSFVENTKLELQRDGQATVRSHRGVRDVRTGLYRFTFEGSFDLRGQHLFLVSKEASGIAFDGKDGTLWSEELVRSDGKDHALLVRGPFSAEFRKIPGALANQNVFATLAWDWLFSSVIPGSVSCAASAKDCTVTPVDQGLKLTTQDSVLGSLNSSIALESNSVLLKPVAGALQATTLEVKLSVSQCAYAFTQLTRGMAESNNAEVLYLATTSGVGSCTAQRMFVEDAKDGSRLGTVTLEADTTEGSNRWFSVVRFDRTPSAASAIDLHFEYLDGEPVSLLQPASLQLQARPNFADVRVVVKLDQDFEISDTKSLATGRDNRVVFDGLPQAQQWTFTPENSTYFKTCPAAEDDNPPSGGACFRADVPTSKTMTVRAERNADAESVGLLSADVTTLRKFTSKLTLGSLVVDTGLSSAPFRLGWDVDKVFSVACFPADAIGSRKLTGPPSREVGVEREGIPTSIAFNDWEHCYLKLLPGKLNSRDRKSGPQSIEVEAALVPSDQTALEYKSLTKVKMEPEQVLDGEAIRYWRLNLTKALGRVKAHHMIELRIKHSGPGYSTKDESSDKSTLVLRLRRRPKTAITGNDGTWGPRIYGDLVIAPATLFRAPHSGRHATTSSETRKLEVAQFGFGAVAVAEYWNYDWDEPILPVLAPQLQVGVLGTLPTQQDLEYPTFSLIAGVGFRTGVETEPTSTVESALKFFIWYERLWVPGPDSSPANQTNNVLFGFSGDVGGVLK